MRGRVFRLMVMLAAIGCILAAGTMNERLVEGRNRHHLVQAEALENSPPLVTFSMVALGGFRGLLVDMLWIRAARLQAQGRYFELVQLADWITKLQPRSTQIWAYHAWNLAYNISVMMTQPEDRWRWVRQGIDLLRNEGLRYNRGSAQLYRELAWLYMHKLGGDMDMHHRYYKQAFAEEMERVLGGRRPDYARWRELPETREAVLKQPGVADVVQAIESAGVDPDAFAALDTAYYTDGAFARVQALPGWPTWAAFIRRRVLRETYRYDPDQMEALERQYGALDWRLPEPHVIYWSTQGLPYADTFEEGNMQRMIFHSLVGLFRKGQLLRSGEGDFARVPDTSKILSVRRAFMKRLEVYDDDAILESYAHFLHEAVLVYAAYGQTDRAEALYEEWKATGYADTARSSLNDFVAHWIREQAPYSEPHMAAAFIYGLCLQARVAASNGDAENAARFRERARDVYDRYMAEPANRRVGRRQFIPPPEALAAWMDRAENRQDQ